MFCLFRVSLVALSLLVCTTGVFASKTDPDPEGVPDAIILSPGAGRTGNPAVLPLPTGIEAAKGGIDPSGVPDAIVLSPGARYPGNPVGLYVVTAMNYSGNVIPNALVEIEFSAGSDAIVGWCSDFGNPTPPQARGIITGMTNVSGIASFEFYGGGCIDPNDFFGASYIAQVRINGIVVNEPFINSPDAVNSAGQKVTDTPPPLGLKRCDLVAGVPSAQVSLSDAVFHTGPIKLGQRELCTKFTAPFNGSVALADAVALTPYVKASNFCRCQ